MTDQELDRRAKQAKALLPNRDAYEKAVTAILRDLMASGMPEVMARNAYSLAAGYPAE